MSSTTTHHSNHTGLLLTGLILLALAAFLYIATPGNTMGTAGSQNDSETSELRQGVGGGGEVKENANE